MIEKDATTSSEKAETVAVPQAKPTRSVDAQAASWDEKEWDKILPPF